MGALLDGGLDLGLLALCYVTIALLLLASAAVSLVAKLVPNPSILGIHPLGWVNDFVNSLQGAIQDALNGVDDAAAKFQSGLLQSLTLLIGIPLLLALGVYDLFTLLLKHTLPGLYGSSIKAAGDSASAVAARVTTLEQTVADNLAKARSYADSVSTSALSNAKTYAATNIAAAAKSLEDDIKTVTQTTAGAIVSADLAAGGVISKAIHAAIDAADFVTSGEIGSDVVDAIHSSAALRDAIANAVPAVGGLTAAQVSSMIAQAIPSVGTLASEVEKLLPASVSNAGETAAAVAGQIADAIANDLAPGGNIAAAIAQAIPGVGTVSPPGSIPSLGDLTAQVGALATAVAGIEAIGFISNESCRSKVGQLCNTDSNALQSLLAGAVAIGVAYNLRDVVDAANAIFTDAADLIQAAA